MVAWLRHLARAGLARTMVEFETARPHLFLFVPVFLGLGIGLYFVLPVEPTPFALAFLGGAALSFGLLAHFGPFVLRPWLAALALVLFGCVLATLRAERVAAPVLMSRYFGPVEGRVVSLDRSASDAVRLTLQSVILPGIDPEATPKRVRVALHGPLPEPLPEPGTRVALTAHLAPPQGPVEPGGYDFRRQAWFQGLGAVGYTRARVVELGPPESGLALALTRLRLRLSAAFQERIPGVAGAFVAAVLTGDRTGIPVEANEALRAANLAHLLAISGLHMGLLTGVVFGLVRGLAALCPPVALRLSTRKIAAVVALVAGAFYLALSGGHVATQRAFVMVAVMLGAVLADRRALSTRSVALAAVVVLLWRPEALLEPGFQMSFAATLALVVTFEQLRKRTVEEARFPLPSHARAEDVSWERPSEQSASRLLRLEGRPRRLLVGLRDLFICSLVAGLATAPFAAAHFHRIADYGLLANLAAVPAMGVFVMPAAVAAAVLWPFGLEGLALFVMELGVRWIFAVAETVVAWPGALRPVTAPMAWVLPTLVLGALWLLLWPGRARVLGLLPMAVAGLAWGLAPRPEVLIAGDGALVGVMGAEGRALSRARGGGFVAEAWLRSDGDTADQLEAAARPGFVSVEGGAAAMTAIGPIVHLWGKAGQAAVPNHCKPGVIVVLAGRWQGPAPGACRLLDERRLARTGALALTRGGVWVSAAEQAGCRPWSPRCAQRPPRPASDGTGRAQRPVGGDEIGAPLGTKPQHDPQFM